MQKNHTREILSVGIICLFIGVGIYPAFAVETKQSIVNKANEEDCGCNEIRINDIIKVQRLLNKVEIYSKLLLGLAKYYPKLNEKIEELSNIIENNYELNKRFSPPKISCAIIAVTIDMTGVGMITLTMIGWFFEESLHISFIREILDPIVLRLREFIDEILCPLYEDTFNCGELIICPD